MEPTGAVAGCERLVRDLDDAVGRSRTVEEVTRAVQRTLSGVIQDGAVELPAHLSRSDPASYARRLVHANPALNYTVLAMVWGPGQGTALHDHAGLWCVEGVLEGRIRVTQYELLERSGGRCRFRRHEAGEEEVGSAGRLIPPWDYHVLTNALPESASITIHVYGGEMDRCNVFEPRDDGWYEEIPRRLVLTA